MVINWLNYGGAERYVTSLANALSQQGDEVFIISAGGISTKRLHKEVIHKVVDSIPLNTRSAILETSRVIEQICLRHKIDLIHCNTPTGLEAASLVKRRIEIPIVFTAHSVPMSGNPMIGSDLDKKADKIIAVSDFIKNHLARSGLNGKAKRIYHGVDTTKFTDKGLNIKIRRDLGLSLKDRVIVCVARLEPEKGIAQLISALPQIKQSIPKAKLVFIGGGSHRNEYEQLPKYLKIDSDVLFLGGRGNVAELLSIADVFCLSSIREALSFAIMEAMSEGKPVVATKVGGVPELVNHGRTGLLVPSRDIDKLASGVIKVLKNRELSKKLTQNARKMIEDNFRFSRMLEETTTLYHEVLKEQKVLA